MAQKVIEFEDGSTLKVSILEGGKLGLILQAKHLGTEIKYTSATVELGHEDTIDLISWIGENLIGEMNG